MKAGKDFLTGNITEESEEEEIILEDKPMKVEITNQLTEKEVKNPTSEDTEDPYHIEITEELIKEYQEDINNAR